MKFIRIALLLLILVIQGCGENNNTAYEPVIVHKEVDWLTSHKTAALQSIDPCKACHSVILRRLGMWSAVACTSCHNGEGPWKI